MKALCRYIKSWIVLEDWEMEAGADFLTSTEKGWLYGKTLRSLIPTAWQT